MSPVGRPPGSRVRSRIPVQLPDGVEHGTANAYGHYHCGCDRCFGWRQRYDRGRADMAVRTRYLRQDAAREYLRGRGLALIGPGPFRRSPYRLALLVARWLNDDLETYVRDYTRRNDR